MRFVAAWRQAEPAHAGGRTSGFGSGIVGRGVSDVSGLSNYRLLIGRPTDLRFDDESPHVHVRLVAAGQSYRVAINVRSSEPPHVLLYARRDPFDHPLVRRLETLGEGLRSIRRKRPELAVDYVRGDMIRREEMTEAPYRRDGRDNDLQDYLATLTREAMRDGRARFHVFGESWGPRRGRVDSVFGFSPDQGMHDVHMNQGSRPPYRRFNAPNQDGALLVRTGGGRWIGIFLAFQNQSWATDPETGHPLEDEEAELLQRRAATRRTA